ncbi:RDD family protein [Microlunatus antarcticus]|uniref:Putative RDD family membrane protein YckC n=1 Tax=Microlunatus antarcticus TaxID=53388 RepID=A0A7W5P6J1_9ACTN|nr:putative RDD family membrane protein YckC [Microlunatus antarcticus]
MAWGPPAPPFPAYGPPPPWGPGAPWTPPPRDDYAGWGRRVAGLVIDHAPSYVALVVLYAGYLPTYLGFFRRELNVPPSYWLVLIGTLLSLGAFGWSVYNRYFLAGRSGQSVGKRVTKTWLVSQTTGRPIGPFNAFLRDLLHIVDGFGYVGYLWPLWDDEHQTLADKLAQTIVVRTPVPPLTDLERRG